MLAVEQETLTNSFLEFATKASNILHIKSEECYEEALETIEHLFAQASDTPNDPLNDLINILSRSVQEYELKKESISAFDNASKRINQEISTLRILMDQHNLTVSDLQNEIGSKSLVSMILSGKRNLTKEHITKLSKKFNVNPALFFDLR